MKTMTRFFAILVTFSGSSAYAESEEPGDIRHHPGETLSAARTLFYLPDLPNSIIEAFDLGIDDTLNAAEANLTPRVSGSSYAFGDVFARSKIETTEAGAQISEVRIVHQAKTGFRMQADSNHYQVTAYTESRNQLCLQPFRLTNNPAPIPLHITCDFSGIILQDPKGSLSDTELVLVVEAELRPSGTETPDEILYGTVHLDSAQAEPNDRPDFGFDLDGIGDYGIYGGGKFSVRAEKVTQVNAAYFQKFDLLTYAAGQIEGRTLSRADAAPWLIDMSRGIEFIISSPDPSVRFFIHEKENPAPQPDLQIGPTLSRLKGDDTFQNNPTALQTAKIKQKKARVKRFYLRLENKGSDPSGGRGDNGILLRGPVRKSHLGLSYFQLTETGPRNVTAAVKAGTYALPGHFEEFGDSFQVRSKQRKTRKPGNRKQCRVTFVATNPGAGGSDSARALIMTR